MTIKNCIPIRKKDAKKGDYGKVLIIGGSENYPFAGMHAALAAYAAGADIVTLISHPSASCIGAINPAIIFNIKLKTSHFKSHDVLVIGMGLEHHHAKIKHIMKRFKGKIVADATAIYTIAKKNLKFEIPAIITPHKGEFEKAFNLKPINKTLHALSTAHNIAILLKGMKDVIAYKNVIEEIKGGSPYMAKAGTGDALAGMVGAFYAITNNPFKAAICASKIFKKAGEAASKIHRHRLKPLHILDYI